MIYCSVTWAERWMRLRDRRTPLVALLLFAGYSGVALGIVTALIRLSRGEPAAGLWRGDVLGGIAALLLAWRAGSRAVFVARAYGWREAVWSLPRLPVANAILIAASARALWRYLRPRRAGWDKTAHVFPAVLPAE